MCLYGEGGQSEIGGSEMALVEGDISVKRWRKAGSMPWGHLREEEPREGKYHVQIP